MFCVLEHTSSQTTVAGCPRNLPRVTSADRRTATSCEAADCFDVTFSFFRSPPENCVFWELVLERPQYV